MVDAAIILILVLLNGIFAMAEMALVSSRRARLQAKVEQGDVGASIALGLLGDVGRLLATMQIGVTLVSVIASAIGGATLAEPLARLLQQFPAVAAYARPVSLAAVVLCITVLSIIVGELVPKRIALARPEPIASALARPMQILSRLAQPVERVLSFAAELIIRLLRVRSDETATVTDAEITHMMREGAAAGYFQEAESAIVEMTLRLGDRRVSAVMTPRLQVDWLDLDDTEAENRRKIETALHSCFPVFQGADHRVAGVIQLKDLIGRLLADGRLDLEAALQPALFIPNTVPALRALEMLRTSGQPIALVVDEYGDFEGVTALADIMEALVGEIAEPGDVEPAIVRRQDGSWLIDGMTGVEEVRQAIGLGRLPDADTGEFHTLGGFIMAQMKRVPHVADLVDVDGFRFEVVGMDGHRVDRVMVQPPRPVHAASEGEA